MRPWLRAAVSLLAAALPSPWAMALAADCYGLLDADCVRASELGQTPIGR
jgi:hypothetical protein